MAATYTVGDGKTYSTIQAGVDAIPGDLSGQGVQTVEVYAKAPDNIYHETVNARAGFTNADSNNYIYLNAMVSHQGQRNQGIIISAPANLVANVTILTFADYSRANGFGVTSDGLTLSFTAVLARQFCLLDSILIYDLQVTTYARCINSYNESTIQNCGIMNITATGVGASVCSGVFAYQVTNGKIYNCAVLNLGGIVGITGSAFCVHSCVSVAFTNCVAANTVGKCFEQRFGNNPTVNYCISDDNTADDWGGAGNQINKDPDTDIKFVNTSVGTEDIHLQAGSCAILAGTNLSGTFTDDIDGDTRHSTVQGFIRTVGTDKTYSTIQAALDAIQGDLSFVFWDVGVDQKSVDTGTPAQTVEVYAGGSHEGNGYFYDEAVNATTGFTNPSNSNHISVIAMVSHAGLKDTGIIIRVPGNSYGFHGCAYTEIDGFGVTYAGNVTANSYKAVLTHRDYVKVKNCIIYDITVVGSGFVFAGIAASSVGLVGIQIINCVVINITAYYAYGIWCYSGSSTLINCSVRGMWDSGGASRGINFQLAVGYTAVVTNCICCDRNSGAGGSKDFYQTAPAGTKNVTYSISEDNSADDWGGAGNQINKDPDTDIKFVSSSNLHIQVGSCAIDAGIVQAGATTDFEGDERGSPGAVCDVGVDEFPGVFAGNAELGIRSSMGNHLAPGSLGVPIDGGL